MAKKSRGLGRGLDALLPESDEMEAGIQQIAIGDIDPNGDQPRRSFPDESLAQLAQSIRDQGVLQPILVTPQMGGRYRIVAGERRWRASRMAGLDTVPCIVRDMDVIQQMEIALVENLQREDLNPIEEAEGYRQLMEQYNLTQEETAQRVGKSRSVVANALRLLNLCPPVRAMVEDGRLSNGHARTILPLSPALQEKAADAILKSDLSVRQTELLVKKLTAEEKDKPAVTTGGLEVNYAEEAAKALGTHLGRGCKIVSGRKKGRIELEYYGMDDLNNLLDALNGLKLK